MVLERKFLDTMEVHLEVAKSGVAQLVQCQLFSLNTIAYADLLKLISSHTSQIFIYTPPLTHSYTSYLEISSSVFYN